LATLAEAEASEGIVIWVMTPAELWYKANKIRAVGFLRGDVELIKATVTDPRTRLELQAVTPEIAWRFETVPMELGDPFDRLIVATAVELGIPLVSADKEVAAVGVVDVIW
jgi:PIN domain nuclease of toxin-antitoxin system